VRFLSVSVFGLWVLATVFVSTGGAAPALPDPAAPLRGDEELDPGSPLVQRTAGEWLLLKIVNHEAARVPGSENRYTVRGLGVVLRPFASDSGLRMGDVITVEYPWSQPAELPEDYDPLVGVGEQPPMLENGEITFAFLEETGEWLYRPGAKAWSFAPPYGIWPEVRQALEMRAPGYLELNLDPAGGGGQAGARLPASMLDGQTSAEAEPEVQPVRFYIVARGEAVVRVRERPAPGGDYETVLLERLDKGDYKAVTGRPPMEFLSTDYSVLRIELPDRRLVSVEPGTRLETLFVPEGGQIGERPPSASERAGMRGDGGSGPREERGGAPEEPQAGEEASAGQAGAEAGQAGDAAGGGMPVPVPLAPPGGGN